MKIVSCSELVLKQLEHEEGAISDEKYNHYNDSVDKVISCSEQEFDNVVEKRQACYRCAHQPWPRGLPAKGK